MKTSLTLCIITQKKSQYKYRVKRMTRIIKRLALTYCHCKGHPYPLSLRGVILQPRNNLSFEVPEIATSPKIRAPRNDVGGSEVPGLSLRNPALSLPCHCEGHGVACGNLSFRPLISVRTVFRYQRLPSRFAPRNDSGGVYGLPRNNK